MMITNNEQSFFLIVISIFLVYFSGIFEGFSQHKYTSYTAHESITKAIRINNELILGRAFFFEKQAQEKPLMFQQTGVKIRQLNQFSNTLSKYIETLQKEINTEQILYEMLAEDAYKKLLFNTDKTLSFKGKQLKIKIDNLYKYAIQINVHELSQLNNFCKANFKTDAIFDGFDENELDYFEYYFSDKSNYGIMMSLNYLLLNIKTFQLLYFGTIMSY